MVLIFLRDFRSSLIVVITIPFSILSAVVCLWVTGQTINIMTLGGLALAVGVLVDEATVSIESIHTHLAGVYCGSDARGGNAFEGTDLHATSRLTYRTADGGDRDRAF